MKIIILIICIFTSINFSYSQDRLVKEPDLDLFKALAEKKAEQFGLYISKIADKATSYQDKQTAIQQVCKLFISDTVNVQKCDSTLTGEYFIYSKKLIKYLQSLCILDYDRVIFELTECVMIGGLKKGNDGNYYGIISFRQMFTGTKGDYTYIDATSKGIEIILKPYKKPNDLVEDDWKWEVFLSNININEPCR